MLYERLSLPWKPLQFPEIQRTIRTAADNLYYEISSHWNVRKGDIQNCEELTLRERIKEYEEDILGPRTPWMKLDYDAWETKLEEMGGTFFLRPKEERPRALYRRHCTWKELAILDRKCSVDGIPWVLDD